MDVHNHTRLLTHAHTSICTWVHIHHHTRAQTKVRIFMYLHAPTAFFRLDVSSCVAPSSRPLGWITQCAGACARMRTSSQTNIAHTNCVRPSTLNIKHATQTPTRKNIKITQTFQLSSHVRMKMSKGTNLISSLTEMIRCR